MCTVLYTWTNSVTHDASRVSVKKKCNSRAGLSMFFSPSTNLVSNSLRSAVVTRSGFFPLKKEVGRVVHSNSRSAGEKSASNEPSSSLLPYIQ